MGLTNQSVGKTIFRGIDLTSQKDGTKCVALVGNPNVGKSTVFNALTGLRQHTGNWPGKTVTTAVGNTQYKGRQYSIVDLPGAYALDARSDEEKVTRDFILSQTADAVIVVCDATALERNLILVLQVLSLTRKVIVSVNLLDEAKKKHIEIDLDALEKFLGVPVVGTSAKQKKGIWTLLEKIETIQNSEVKTEPKSVEVICEEATRIAKNVIRLPKENPMARDRKIDKVISGRISAYPVMLVLLLFVFWLTIRGANFPSEILAALFFRIEEYLRVLLSGAPLWLSGLLLDGAWRVTSTVISVMLPPMAIFFPLFTFLEDAGFLPRIAFNVDRCFRKCHACGKQALSMCMGFGCNAAGVIGCRIMDSPRERLIAILTNSLVPCNGRFPTLIAILTMFFAAGGLAASLGLCGLVILSVMITLLSSAFLSQTVLRGKPSSFILEMPPYRMPKVGEVLVRSLLDRTAFVLGRAIKAAAPAGLLIWTMANIHIGDASILSHFTAFFDPFGRFLGMDGVILMAFILGLPANEMVMPVILMAYLSGGTIMEMSDLHALKEVLLLNGWSDVTALCTMLFSLFHWPCATTLMTVYKETGSKKYTFLAAILPTAWGVLLCALTAWLSRIIG